MKRPLIGITTDCNKTRTRYESPYAYSAAVERAGGLPFLIPYHLDLSLIAQIVDRLDGIVFSGGDDLDPQRYGESHSDGVEPIDPFREAFECALMAEVERRRMPTLGICLGSQLMNVCRGGSLHQFLPDHPRHDAIEHRRLGDWSRRHPVVIDGDSKVAERMRGAAVVVNTSHKQSVNRLGRGLRVIATSPDGIVEGIEDPEMPLFVGVQWHPERMTDRPEQLALFEMLVEKSIQARS